MRGNTILQDQVIYVKRGRQNGFGFEPLWNAYFDFYLDRKFFGQPLLEMEDVTFHLYLRKNLNDKNPNWKMPTIRQIRDKFGKSNDKIYAMLGRLEKAHLLTKESGVRTGAANERNDYILSDPIPTLAEFIEVAAEGLFGSPLLTGYDPDSENLTKRVPEIGTRVPEIETHVPVSGTDQQTLNSKQTFEKQTFEKQAFDPIFANLRFLIGEKIFDRFLTGAKVLAIEDGVAVIGSPFGYAKDFIERQLANKLKHALQVQGVRCVVLTEA